MKSGKHTHASRTFWHFKHNFSHVELSCFYSRKMHECLSCVFYTTCRYTPEQQVALVSNVFLTGGNMQYPGMKERVERELLAMRPFQSHFKVQRPVSSFKTLFIIIHSSLKSQTTTQNISYPLTFLNDVNVVPH